MVKRLLHLARSTRMPRIGFTIEAEGGLGNAVFALLLSNFGYLLIVVFVLDVVSSLMVRIILAIVGLCLKQE